MQITGCRPNSPPQPLLLFKIPACFHRTGNEEQDTDAGCRPTSLKIAHMQIPARPRRKYVSDVMQDPCGLALKAKHSSAQPGRRFTEAMLGTENRGKSKGEAFLLTVGAFLLTVKLLCLQSLKALIRRTFPL